jgi:hypothetical protein
LEEFSNLHPAWLPQHGKVQGKSLGESLILFLKFSAPPWLNINKTNEMP